MADLSPPESPGSTASSNSEDTGVVTETVFSGPGESALAGNLGESVSNAHESDDDVEDFGTIDSLKNEGADSHLKLHSLADINQTVESLSPGSRHSDALLHLTSVNTAQDSDLPGDDNAASHTGIDNAQGSTVKSQSQTFATSGDLSGSQTSSVDPELGVVASMLITEDTEDTDEEDFGPVNPDLQEGHQVENEGSDDDDDDDDDDFGPIYDTPIEEQRNPQFARGDHLQEEGGPGDPVARKHRNQIIESDSDFDDGDDLENQLSSKDLIGLSAVGTDGHLSSVAVDDQAVADVIADIFGDSDDEGEEFEGFGETEIQTADSAAVAATVAEDADDVGADDADTAELDVSDVDDLDDDDALSDVDDADVFRKRSEKPADFVSDFDIMLQKRKEMNRGQRRRRKDVDIINDSDDMIDNIIKEMKAAAEEDRALNHRKQAATKKLKMSQFVLSQLNKSDLMAAFLDCGVLSAITEWLAPLPDKSLPHLHVREGLLKVLQAFSAGISSDSLKSSGIGKAVMYLYKHPKETKGNRERAGKLINQWSRPIFNLTSNYKDISREEREERDYEHVPKQRRLSSGGRTPGRGDINRAFGEEQRPLRPGDKGFVSRARVPQPSIKDYVVRPKSTVEDQIKPGNRRPPPSRYDKHQRAFAERRKFQKHRKAVEISIEGRKML